jgi:hypothetical protein
MRRNKLLDVVLTELRSQGIQEVTVENGGKHVLVRWSAKGRIRTTTISHSGSRNWRVRTISAPTCAECYAKMGTPLEGMQFLLCRTRDITRPCCRNLAYYRNGKLWCVDCKRPRGRLSASVIDALVKVLNVFPGIMSETHILRDTSELPDDEEGPTTDTVESDPPPCGVRESDSAAPLEGSD